MKTILNLLSIHIMKLLTLINNKIFIKYVFVKNVCANNLIYKTLVGATGFEPVTSSL